MPPRRELPFSLERLIAKGDLVGTVLEYPLGQVIFSQGDASDGIWHLQKGSVKLTVVSPGGKEAIIAILAAGNFFGEGCLAGEQLRLATASAASISTVLRIGQKSFTRLLHQNHECSDYFVRQMLLRNMRIQEDLVDQLFNSTEKRLARALLLIAHYGTEGEPSVDIPNFNQETLAEMIGTSRARVSFFMNKFRKLGFIEYNGKIKVHKSLLNIVLHE
jgi:CRP-like cAMP-binding protein